MSTFMYCMLLANIYLAANFVRTKYNPVVLWGFGTFWLALGLLSKLWEGR